MGRPEGPGEEVVYEGFPSHFLGNRRRLTVRLPPGHAADLNQRCPVLYLHDGQNLLGPARSAFGVSWQAGETADRLTVARRIRPIILVGIDNTPERLDEYTAVRDARQEAGGRGDLYARFVLEEVKPFVDRAHRTLPGREHTAVAGSSLGGLVSLTMALRHHERFALCGVLSPALWWARESVFAELAGDLGWMRSMRFWLCMGTREGSGRGHVSAHLERTRRLAGLFDAAGLVPGRDYYYQEVAGGEHTEAAWAARFDRVLRFFFGRRPR